MNTKENNNSTPRPRKDDFKTIIAIENAKYALQQKNISMSGHNNHNSYDYFELKDITKPITEVLLEQNLGSKFIFKKDKAKLRIYSETGYCEWETPLKLQEPLKPKYGDYGIKMKMEQGIQTYARRTLWLQAMEIIEHIEIEGDGNTQKAEIINTNEQLVDYFLNQKNKEGFDKTEIQQQLDDLLKNEEITDEYYQTISQYCQKMKPDTRLYASE